jgi:hypothetical protein
MAHVPRLYVPIYILIRLPLLMLFGAGLGIMFALLLSGSKQMRRRDVALVVLTVIFPLACQVIWDGPAFTGLRHFLFVVPALAVLAGVGLDTALARLTRAVAWRLAPEALPSLHASFGTQQH